MIIKQEGRQGSGRLFFFSKYIYIPVLVFVLQLYQFDSVIVLVVAVVVIDYYLTLYCYCHFYCFSRHLLLFFQLSLLLFLMLIFILLLLLLCLVYRRILRSVSVYSSQVGRLYRWFYASVSFYPSEQQWDSFPQVYHYTVIKSVKQLNQLQMFKGL